MMHKSFRGLAALSLALVLLVSLGLAALAAESASATDLRLESVEGTVTVTNASGKKVTIREGMKLYSGYSLTTSSKSYAYVSLDGSKVVKLDAGSQAEIRKQGKKLEVLLEKGNLFFNVKVPLSSSETLNIRTSTMVTGIRGTSGYVQIKDSTQSSVTVLDGQVSVTTPDANSQTQFETVTVQAGQTGQVKAMDEDSWQVSTETITEADVPGFVAVEIAGDAELQQRIEDDTDLSTADIAAGAQDRLAADEAQAASGDTARLPSGTTPLFPGQESGGTSGSTPTPPDDDEENEGEGEGEGGDEENPPATDFTISGSVSGTQLQEYLNTYETVTVAEGAVVTIAESENVTLVSGKTLTNRGSVTVAGSLTNEGGTFVGKGPATSGTGYVSGIVCTPDGMEVDTAGVYHLVRNMTGTELQACVTTNGLWVPQITVDSGVAITVAADETVNFTNSITLTIAAGASFAVNGTLRNYDTIVNQGTLTLSGDMMNFGTITNSGDWNVAANGNFVNHTASYGSIGTVQNNGSITVSGVWDNGYPASDQPLLVNAGTLTITNTLNNYGTIQNKAGATLDNQGTVQNQTVATLTNDGTYYGAALSGTIDGANASQAQNGNTKENP